MKLRFALASLAAAICGLAVHVGLLRLIDPVVGETMQALGAAGHHLTRPEDSPAVAALAAVTSVLEQGPAFVIAFLLVANALPFRSRLEQALACAALLLAVRGDLLRMPIMNVAIGNPVRIALLQQTEHWAAVLAACLVTALVAGRATAPSRPRTDAAP
jgi:hypothetical protein